MGSNGDLISRSALLEKEQWFADNYDCDCFPFIDPKDVENAPAVDAVEVVRCKDCAKCDYVEETPVDGGVWICRLSRTLVYKNHFCSYGQRRGENGRDK